MRKYAIVLLGIDCELERTGWSIILISVVGFLIWIILSFLLMLFGPDTLGEPVWEFYPFMMTFAVLVGLGFFVGFALMIAAHCQKGKVEMIYY
jgi:hypothetical protein